MSGVIHLDTNVLIFATDAKHPVREALRDWRAQGSTLAVSAMAWAEFACGPASPALLKSWEQLLGTNIITVDKATADLAASLFNHTGRRSRSLPDCLIAATALLHKARLATLNRADFEPMLKHGLILA